MVDTGYLIGLGILDQRMVVLIDIDQIMSSTEIGVITRLVA